MWNEQVERTAVDLEETVTKIDRFRVSFQLMVPFQHAKGNQLSYFTVSIFVCWIFGLTFQTWCCLMKDAWRWPKHCSPTRWQPPLENKKSPDSKQHNDMVLTEVSEPKLVTRSRRYLTMCVQQKHVWPNDDMMLQWIYLSITYTNTWSHGTYSTSNNID